MDGVTSTPDPALVRRIDRTMSMYDGVLTRLEREQYHGLTADEYADKLEAEGRRA